MGSHRGPRPSVKSQSLHTHSNSTLQHQSHEFTPRCAAPPRPQLSRGVVVHPPPPSTRRPTRRTGEVSAQVQVPVRRTSARLGGGWIPALPPRWLASAANTSPRRHVKLLGLRRRTSSACRTNSARAAVTSGCTMCSSMRSASSRPLAATAAERAVRSIPPSDASEVGKASATGATAAPPGE